MRIASLVARYLLGLLFTIFGLNGLLENVGRGFIHNPPPPNPLALEFIHATGLSHSSVGFFSLQFLGGLCLLLGYFVPLALTVLAAELFNILVFHLSFAPAAIGPGLVASILWLLVFLHYRKDFADLLSANKGTDSRRKFSLDAWCYVASGKAASHQPVVFIT